jgi:hypothetical protein
MKQSQGREKGRRPAADIPKSGDSACNQSKIADARSKLSLQLKNHELFHLTACVRGLSHSVDEISQNEQTALMSEMASSAKSKVFQVTGLPVGKAEPDLVQTIRDNLSNDEQHRPYVALRLPLERSAALPNDDLWLQLKALES